MSTPFNVLWHSLLDLVFPPRCLVCQTQEGDFLLPTLCESCWPNLYAPLETEPGVWSAAEYRDHIQTNLLKAKMEADPLPTGILERLLVETARGNLPHRFDAVTSIPANPSHVRKRGIDLPHWLARKVAKRLATPFRDDLLRRVRTIPPQMSLSRAERLENVRGAFEGSEACKDLAILVIDDVVTTGATSRAAREALVNVNAKTVLCLAIARTPFKQDN